MTVDADRRNHPRLDGDEALFVRVSSAGGETIDEGHTVRCSSENLSLDGLCLRLSEPIPEGTLLELWIRVKDHAGTFLLTGMTKWVKIRESGGALVGIQLVEDSAGDLGAWRAMVVRKLRDAR